MKHLTETGAYPGNRLSGQSIHAREGSSISASFVRNFNLNRPLPWVCLFALILIAYMWVDSERRADMRVQITEAAERALAANQRLSDKIASDTQVQIAYEQTLKFYTGEVVKAQTETRMLEYYAVELTAAAKEAKIIPVDYSFEKFKQQQRGK